MRTCRMIPTLLAVGCVTACAPIRDTDPMRTDRTGPWLGQTPPGAEPEVFAPGIVSTHLFTRDLTFTPDGAEMYWTVIHGSLNVVTIATSRQVNGRWTRPAVAPFATDPAYQYLEPHISPDGTRFYFVSNRPATGSGDPARDRDIWVMDREGDGWGSPRPLGGPVNTPGGEYFPSTTRDGVLYFTRRPEGENDDFIYRAAPAPGGGFAEPVRLPHQVNAGGGRFNAFVDPDERFLIVPIFNLAGGHGRTDYWICFRSANGEWSDPVNLGDRINTAGNSEYSASLSPDGRYLFFMSLRPPQIDAGSAAISLGRLLDMALMPGRNQPAIWWVDASFLETLRP